MSFNIYQKAFLVQMGVLPISKNEEDRDCVFLSDRTRHSHPSAP